MLLLHLPMEIPSILTFERLGVFEFFSKASSGPFGWIFDRKGTTRSVNLPRRAFCSWFESGAMRFSVGKSLRSWCRYVQKINSILVLLLRGTVNSELKIAQNTTSETKGRL